MKHSAHLRAFVRRQLQKIEARGGGGQPLLVLERKKTTLAGNKVDAEGGLAAGGGGGMRLDAAQRWEQSGRTCNSENPNNGGRGQDVTNFKKRLRCCGVNSRRTFINLATVAVSAEHPSYLACATRSSTSQSPEFFPDMTVCTRKESNSKKRRARKLQRKKAPAFLQG
jgi:hypothetical protein